MTDKIQTGTNVRYTGKATFAQGIEGKVLKTTPAHTWTEAGETFTSPAYATVQVIDVPDNWPYIGSNVFAPDLDDLEPIP